MTDERWLRDALRRAASEAPARDRAGAALALVTRRRRQRVVAVSCTAAVAVVAAAVVTSGGAATTGLEPVATATSSAPEPTASPVATPSPERSETPSPAPASPTERPAATPSTAAPVAPAPADPAPETPSPAPKPAFDVYFLVDATASMQPHGEALSAAVADVAERLGRTTTLRHGYGLFRDIAVTEGGHRYGDPVYERVAAVRANAGRLPAITYGGGGDEPEAHTIALRSAIGRADDPWTDGKTPAGFGDGVTRIVVLVTNAAVNRGDRYPTIAETVRDLNAEGVAVATLLLPPREDEEGVRRDMAAFSNGTGAVAAADADCNGDGRTDLRSGDPLVCDVLASGGYAGFADALVARLRTMP